MSELHDQMLGTADSFVALCAANGCALDYSLESLHLVDAFLETHLPQGVPTPKGPLYDQTLMKIFGVGIYVGEVMRRNLGGEWSDAGLAQSSFGYSVVMEDGAVVWPVLWAMNRQECGMERSLYSYAACFRALYREGAPVEASAEPPPGSGFPTPESPGVVIPEAGGGAVETAAAPGPGGDAAADTPPGREEPAPAPLNEAAVEAAPAAAAEPGAPPPAPFAEPAVDRPVEPVSVPEVSAEAPPVRDTPPPDRATADEGSAVDTSAPPIEPPPGAPPDAVAPATSESSWLLDSGTAAPSGPPSAAAEPPPVDVGRPSPQDAAVVVSPEPSAATVEAAPESAASLAPPEAAPPSDSVPEAPPAAPPDAAPPETAAPAAEVVAAEEQAGLAPAEAAREAPPPEPASDSGIGGFLAAIPDQAQSPSPAAEGREDFAAAPSDTAAAAPAVPEEPPAPAVPDAPVMDGASRVAAAPTETWPQTTSAPDRSDTEPAAETGPAASAGAPPPETSGQSVNLGFAEVPAVAERSAHAPAAESDLTPAQQILAAYREGRCSNEALHLALADLASVWLVADPLALPGVVCAEGRKPWLITAPERGGGTQRFAYAFTSRDTLHRGLRAMDVVNVDDPRTAREFPAEQAYRTIRELAVAGAYWDAGSPHETVVPQAILDAAYARAALRAVSGRPKLLVAVTPPCVGLAYRRPEGNLVAVGFTSAEEGARGLDALIRRVPRARLVWIATSDLTESVARSSTLSGLWINPGCDTERLYDAAQVEEIRRQAESAPR